MSATTHHARRLAPADRRAQITGAALEVFASRTEDEVGLEDIAAAARVTRNLLYRYFSSRAEIQRAAYDEAVVRVAARMITDPGRPLCDKLPRNMAMWLDAVESGDPAVRLIRRATRSADPGIAHRVGESRAALADAIARNHLGAAEPPPQVLAALDGYLALSERLIDRWTEAGDLGRAEVEEVLAAVLPPLVAAAGRAR